MIRCYKSRFGTFSKRQGLPTKNGLIPYSASKREALTEIGDGKGMGEKQSYIREKEKALPGKGGGKKKL